MDTNTLQQELIELILLIQNLTPSQIKGLCQFCFIERNFQEGWLIVFSKLLLRATSNQVEDLLALSENIFDLNQKNEAEARLKPLASEFGILVKDLVDKFNFLFQVFHLQGLLQSLSILQLMKLFEVIPPGPTVQQEQLLNQIEQLFSQLQPETLSSIHKKMEEAQPGTEHQTLAQILGLPLDHFQLYQPLLLLLQLDLDELLKLREELPKLTQIQNKQLIQLLQMQPFDVLELRSTMNPYDNTSQNDMIFDESNFSDKNYQQTSSSLNMDKRLSLQIVEQPPEKSVYKRNLKPNPMIMLVGDQKITGNLFIAVVLIRCDNFFEEQKFLIGNRPERVTSSRIVTFKKLKITTTSHQQQETLFCLRFELRNYTNEDEYEILDSVHSNPICVLSHSTQMKPIPSSAPTISEVIPPYGPPTGGTRVAILGSNFVDNPAARIRFDTTDVIPIFHGAGTLICHTPQHQPGAVSVRVCNSGKKWSESSATFTYDSSLETFKDPLLESVVSTHNFENDVSNASWQGNNDVIRRLHESGSPINTMDSRGYSPIHYACAQGNTEMCSFLLEKGVDVNVQDKHGSTSLFWASLFGYEDIVQILVDHGAQVNIPNYEGITPLITSVIQRYERILNILLENGASPNICTLRGESPLHISSVSDSPEISNTLIQYGAYLNAIDEEGETPLHWAVRESKVNSLCLLLQNGAYIDATNNDDETPVHLATILGDLDSIQSLLHFGASLSTQDVAASSKNSVIGFPQFIQDLLNRDSTYSLDKKEEISNYLINSVNFFENSLNNGKSKFPVINSVPIVETNGQSVGQNFYSVPSLYFPVQ